MLVFFAWLVALSWPQKGKIMKMRLTSTFKADEIEKASRALFDLFQIELHGTVLTAATMHLREQFLRFADDHHLSHSQILTVYAEFERLSQTLTVWVDNSQGIYKNGTVLKLNALLPSMSKGFLERVRDNGIARVAR